MEKTHVISVLVENRFGVLAHISGLFSSRAFNIDSLTVGETHDTTISRMTIVVKGDDRILEQVTKQLNKLIDVIKVQDLTIEDDFIERELVLVKINSIKETRAELIQIIEIFKGEIVDYSPKFLTVELVGRREKISNFIELIRNFGIRELARTGIIALPRATS